MAGIGADITAGKRGTGVGFKPVKNLQFEDEHNLREGPEPRYLLPEQYRLRDSSGAVLTTVVVRADPQMHERYAQRIAQCSQRALREKVSPYWHGVVYLPLPKEAEGVDAYRDRLVRDMKSWSERYEKLTGHQVLQAAVHFDEGHVDEMTGELMPNPHAHVIVDRMQYREAHTVETKRGTRRIPARATVRKLDPERLRKVQDMTATLFTGEAAEDRRTRVAREKAAAKAAGIPERGHINHREYRALMRKAEREYQRKLARVGNDVAALIERAEGAEAERDSARAERDAAQARAQQAERKRDETRAGSGNDRGQHAGADGAEISDAEIDAGVEAITRHAREHRMSLNSREQIRSAYLEVRDSWKAAPGTHSARNYTVLRLAHERLQTDFERSRAERAEQQRDSARAERDEARAADGAKEPTPDDIAASRRALERYARERKIPLGSREGVKQAYDGLYREWRANRGTHSQIEYMALRAAHMQLQAERGWQRSDRERAKRRRDRQRSDARERQRDGFSIGGRPVQSGYRSAELAAARALGIRYEWDPARGQVYHDRLGRELFCAERRRIEMLEHDAIAEHAALKIAAAKWGGAVTIGGSAGFRERMARSAAREGIEVEDADLEDIVRDERARMARGEPPGGVERDRPGAEIETEDGLGEDEDLGR